MWTFFSRFLKYVHFGINCNYAYEIKDVNKCKRKYLASQKIRVQDIIFASIGLVNYDACTAISTCILVKTPQSFFFFLG